MTLPKIKQADRRTVFRQLSKIVFILSDTIKIWYLLINTPQIINLLNVPKFFFTPALIQLQEWFTFPFGPILENAIIGQHSWL